MRYVSKKILLVLFFFSASASAESLQEYAKACDEAMEGVSVKGFNCLSGEIVQMVGHTGQEGSRCNNPSTLKSDCARNSRLGWQDTGPSSNIEIRWMCRHYDDRSSASSPTFNDIAVIQHNKRTGATCFYQSNIASHDGTKVPAPISGDTKIFKMSELKSVPCVGCHDIRGFIKTPYLKEGVRSNSPAQVPGFEANPSGYFFPGALPQELNWRVWTIKLKSGDQSCASCHNMASNNQGSSSYISKQSALLIRNDGLSSAVNTPWMGTPATRASAEAFVKCMENGDDPNCVFSERPGHALLGKVGPAVYMSSSWLGQNALLSVINGEPKMEARNNTPNQRWATTTAQVSGLWFTTYVHMGTGKCLTNSGNRLILADCNKGTGQLWINLSTGGFQQLSNQAQCLDVVNDGQNRNLQMTSCGNFSGQHWNLSFN